MSLLLLYVEAVEAPVVAAGGGSFHDGFYGSHPVHFYGGDALDVYVDAGIASEEAFGTPLIFTVAASVGIPSEEAFGLPTVSHASVGIPSGEVFGTPTIRLAVQPAGIPSAEAFGTTSVVQVVRPSGIPSAEAFGTPQREGFVAAESLPSEEAFGVPTLQYVVQPTGIPSGEAVGTPSVNVELVFASSIDSAEDFGIPAFVEAVWWNSRYPYRRNYTLTASSPEMLPVNHPIVVQMPAYSTEQGKVRSDLQDVEVLYLKSGVWFRLPREATVVGDSIFVRFLLAEEILAAGEANYYLYYGNRNATGMGRPGFVDNPWPVSVDGGSVLIDYTRPTEHWNSGASITHRATGTFEFSGTAARWISDLGPTAGVAEVQLDDNPWALVDLYSPAEQLAVPIYEWTELQSQKHKVRMRVSNTHNPKSSGDEVNVVRVDYVASYSFADGGEEVDESAWGALVLVGEE